MIFFDLPTITTSNRRDYRKFRKHLLKNGFLMLQESVYCKLALNSTASDVVMENIRKNKPKAGLVQMMVITEKQFSKIEFVVGEANSTFINSVDRLIIL